MAGVLDTLQQIAACVVAQFEEDGLPAPCFAGLLPGDAVAHDYSQTCTDDGDGMLWVRLAAAYPATATGVVDETVGNCGKSLGLDVEVGVIRRAALPDDQGDPPSEAEQAAVVEQQIKDMLAVKKALKCCVALKGMDHRLLPYQPVGPGGDVVGGLWGVSIAL